MDSNKTPSTTSFESRNSHLLVWFTSNAPSYTEMKSVSFDPDEFEYTEEEVKFMKDQIYLRALSGKLYQKTHIPAVAVLPTIYEEDETFGETDKQQSCLTDQQGVLNGSLCNLFDPSAENDETSEESQQKPKKKKMERLREFLARIFCCVKPP